MIYFLDNVFPPFFFLTMPKKTISQTESRRNLTQVIVVRGNLNMRLCRCYVQKGLTYISSNNFDFCFECVLVNSKKYNLVIAKSQFNYIINKTSRIRKQLYVVKK